MAYMNIVKLIKVL